MSHFPRMSSFLWSPLRSMFENKHPGSPPPPPPSLKGGGVGGVCLDVGCKTDAPNNNRKIHPERLSNVQPPEEDMMQ